MKRVGCACGWEIRGTEEQIVPAVIDHGERFHNMHASRDDVVASLENVPPPNAAEQLVYTESTDGYLLEGALFTPAEGGQRRLPVVWMHGFTGRFYERHAVDIGRRLAERGHVFLTGNNRGHHLGANLINLRGGESRRGGAFWERFDECPNDFSAWISYVIGLGFTRVVLVGHSLGAVKSVYYMGTCGDARVAGLVSASGPLQMGRRAPPEQVALAQRMVAEGRAGELLPGDDAASSTSAQTLAWRASANVDVYGADRPDAPLTRITPPILFVLGSAEPDIGVESDLERLRQNARSAQSVDTLYVQGADHIYRGHETEVADGIGDWIDRLTH